MNLKDLQNIRIDLDLKETEILEKANAEYSNDKDALDNFKLIGRILDLPPEKVAAVYWLKHVIGITKYINGNTNQRDSFQGRANDARNYIVLLAGLIKEREVNDVPEPSWDGGQ